MYPQFNNNNQKEFYPYQQNGTNGQQQDGQFDPSMQQQGGPTPDMSMQMNMNVNQMNMYMNVGGLGQVQMPHLLTGMQMPINATHALPIGTPANNIATPSGNANANPNGALSANYYRNAQPQNIPQRGTGGSQTQQNIQNQMLSNNNFRGDSGAQFANGGGSYHKDFEPNKKDFKSEINAMMITDEEFNQDSDIRKNNATRLELTRRLHCNQSVASEAEQHCGKVQPVFSANVPHNEVQKCILLPDSFQIQRINSALLKNNIDEIKEDTLFFVWRQCKNDEHLRIVMNKLEATGYTQNHPNKRWENPNKNIYWDQTSWTWKNILD